MAIFKIPLSSLFLGNGQLINPRDLTLGGCAALDTSDHILLFQTELQGCGSIITVHMCGFPSLVPVASTESAISEIAAVTIQADSLSAAFVR